MLKTQLMTGMALSILFSGGFAQTAWSKDATAMEYKHSNRTVVPWSECQLANDPNVRFFRAPNCPPTANPQSTIENEYEYDNAPEPYTSWHQPGTVLKQLPQPITYPKRLAR